MQKARSHPACHPGWSCNTASQRVRVSFSLEQLLCRLSRRKWGVWGQPLGEEKLTRKVPLLRCVAWGTSLAVKWLGISCQSRGQGSDPVSGKIPRAWGQPNLPAATAEARALGPKLCNKRGHRMEKLTRQLERNPQEPYTEQALMQQWRPGADRKK